MGIAFSTRDGQLCPYGGDGIVFEGLSREEVSIRSISRLTPLQEEQLMVRYGKAPGAEPQIPVPEPVEGAVVKEPD